VATFQRDGFDAGVTQRSRDALIDLRVLLADNNHEVSVKGGRAEAWKAVLLYYHVTARLELARFFPTGRVVNTFPAPRRALGRRTGFVSWLLFANGDLAHYVADPSHVEAVASLRTNVRRICRTETVE
jgi:hypothetical protein